MRAGRRYSPRMPVSSRFLGIAIAILYRDHDPPHFHAIYGEFEVTVGITDGVVTGRFPRRALATCSSGPRCTATSCSPIGTAPV